MCMDSNRMAAICHLHNNCKMAVAGDKSATEQVRDVLELLATPAHCCSFSERGKRQIQELHCFKKRSDRRTIRKDFAFFANPLLAIYAAVSLRKRLPLMQSERNHTKCSTKRGSQSFPNNGMIFMLPLACISLIQCGCRLLTGFCSIMSY